MNVTPTSCNIDNIVSIQDSLLSEIEASSSTPPTPSNEGRLDVDNIEASLGIAFINKSRRN